MTENNNVKHQANLWAESLNVLQPAPNGFANPPTANDTARRRMTYTNNLLTALRFDIVDGLYLQDNDVEHEDYVLVEDLAIWFGENPGINAPTKADIMLFALSISDFHSHYSIDDEFVTVPSILEKIEKLKELEING